jgi:hypothetical protein
MNLKQKLPKPFFMDVVCHDWGVLIHDLMDFWVLKGFLEYFCELPEISIWEPLDSKRKFSMSHPSGVKPEMRVKCG